MAAQTAKKEGNRLFSCGSHKEAIIKYTEAIDLDPTDVTFFSNRSAACGTVSLRARRESALADQPYVIIAQ